jgi:hypothetical protein
VLTQGGARVGVTWFVGKGKSVFGSINLWTLASYTSTDLVADGAAYFRRRHGFLVPDMPRGTLGLLMF